MCMHPRDLFETMFSQYTLPPCTHLSILFVHGFLWSVYLAVNLLTNGQRQFSIFLIIESSQYLLDCILA